MPVAPAEPLKFHLIDDALLVLDKPAGLLCVPGRGDDKQDCLSARVQAQYPDALIVHRLDMATSGLLLMARGLAAQRILSLAFAGRRVHKQYTAVVHGLVPDPPHTADASADWGLIDLPIAADWPRRPLRIIDAERGKPSQTRWRIESRDKLAGTTRLQLEPQTGRTHQLRVHLQAIGHPILGDALYGADEPPAQTGRLLLHASALAFAHPVTGESLQFTSAASF
jgi:tRNA pseudouridine32 synthase/23S rRNA pseudouridine746 synthase